MSRIFKTVRLILVLAAAVGSASAQTVAGGACGSLENGYGPFDYRSDKNKLSIVETFHFTPSVETLKSGKSGYLGADLDYTLRAFPNHHRALMSMMKLGQREKVAKPRGAQFSVECYMQRAEVFRPTDGMVKTVYGLYLLKAGRAQEAIGKLEAARGLDERDYNVHYNLGLAYVELGNYDQALVSAHRAYAAGFPLPGLRDKLKRAGKWRDVPVAARAGAVVPSEQAGGTAEGNAASTATEGASGKDPSVAVDAN